MRILTIAAALLVVGLGGVASPAAEAKPSAKHLSDCRKATGFSSVAPQYLVLDETRGTALVRVTEEHWYCRNKQTGRESELVTLRGLVNEQGNTLVPMKYAKVFPFSTKGAVVASFEIGSKFFTYAAGKGEGKERFDFQSAMMTLPDSHCLPASMDFTTAGVSAVMGEVWAGVGGDKSNVTLFSPDGTPRKLENVGGKDLRPAVRRVGDTFIARWRDERGMLRSGILDLEGRRLSPVLSDSVLYVTPTPGAGPSVDRCTIASLDAFIYGPSLDVDPTKPFFGNLLYPVGRDGQPVAMPEGAIGMFPGYWRKNGATYLDSVPNVSAVWGVVFPKGDGFEYTLHAGTPSEALVAAQTGARYTEIGRTETYGGMIAAKAAADGKWRMFRTDTDIAVGEASAEYAAAYSTAHAVLAAEYANSQQALAAARAEEEARRVEEQRRVWQAARSTGRICYVRVDVANTREDFEEYLAACGPSNFPQFAELALAKGITAEAMKAAADARLAREMAARKAIAEQAEQDRIRRMQTANQDPGASYYPGQWESAIRNAGNVAVDAINQSSDNWLQQRQDQYIADWQRSQRAY